MLLDLALVHLLSSLILDGSDFTVAHQSYIIHILAPLGSDMHETFISTYVYNRGFEHYEDSINRLRTLFNENSPAMVDAVRTFILTHIAHFHHFTALDHDCGVACVNFVSSLRDLGCSVVDGAIGSAPLHSTLLPAPVMSLDLSSIVSSIRTSLSSLSPNASWASSLFAGTFSVISSVALSITNSTDVFSSLNTTSDSLNRNNNSPSIPLSPSIVPSPSISPSLYNNPASAICADSSTSVLSVRDRSLIIAVASREAATEGLMYTINESGYFVQASRTKVESAPLPSIS